MTLYGLGSRSVVPTQLDEVLAVAFGAAMEAYNRNDLEAAKAIFEEATDWVLAHYEPRTVGRHRR